MDVAKITRVPHASILSIEEGHYESLPAPVFVRGFIRAYCREVDLEPGEVLSRYDAYLLESELEGAEEQELNLAPLLLSGPEVGSAAGRGLQISHVLLLLLALVTFIIAYVTAGVPSKADVDDAAAQSEATHQTTTSPPSSIR